jgi:spore maturation protein CgeB
MIDTKSNFTALSQFRDRHRDQSIIVCGCGESLNELPQPERFITIGVNDVGRRFTPNYLVVVNPRNQFTGDRFRHVESSQAEYIFTQLNLGLSRQNIVKFQLGTYGGTDLSNPRVLHHTQNSPYVALCLAVLMGAKRIGIIGVDFTDHHFFAPTGKHSLSPHLSTIDAQYKRLYEAIKNRGVEVYNLSSKSRLTAFPKSTLEEFTAGTETHVTNTPAVQPRPRVFVVDYDFLTCGQVFGTGLRRAAEQLGITHEGALWDDPQLANKIDRFQPHLIFVVHGRRFAQKWKTRFNRYKTAVWLVDEPYEVDDTVRWSRLFGTVFVNDPNTLTLHANAHYLPVCFDSRVHCDEGLPRPYKVGFIGGSNNTREQHLNEIAESGLLSYVVGGPWRSPLLQQLSLGRKFSPEQVTKLYKQTQVIVNVFREVHHFNHNRVPAHSLNPRIYEALACGALVVSEKRPELDEMLPDLPTFGDPAEMSSTLKELLANDTLYTAALAKSRARLAGHSYADRLAIALRISLGIEPERQLEEDKRMSTTAQVTTSSTTTRRGLREDAPVTQLAGWLNVRDGVRMMSDGTVLLSTLYSDEPGSETGLASERAYEAVELSFDLLLDADTWFIAKLLQADQLDQMTNSYHLVANPRTSYLAKHHHVLGHQSIARGRWQRISFRRHGEVVEVAVDGMVTTRVSDEQLRSGYCFIGVKGGSARLRNIQVTDLSRSPIEARVESVSLPVSGTIGPFTATPRRNLIYHVWPVRGAMWQWNLDQLKRRVDIFNGRRILGIVHDDRSVLPEEVQEFVAGHGFEFVIEKNDERGEVVTFPKMMERLTSSDSNEITFYGHAKGVKYEPNISLAVMRWAEAQYQAALDDWLGVREHLERFAMTGCFKRYGQFSAHRKMADWHYSGTFFWMRNAHVFSKNYQDVPQFYGGVETWPGRLFRKEETGCLLVDNVRQHPYSADFWRNFVQPELRRRQGTRKWVAPPADLVQPLPYKGYTVPRMEQVPEEFEWWVELLLKERVSRILTIGSHEGGVEWHLAREFFEQNRKVEITAIEKDPHPELRQTFRDAEQRFGQTLRLVVGDSTAESTRTQLADQYDAVFIDGDHSYKGSASDFQLALSLKPRIIGLHDIVDSDWHAAAHCCVSRLWSELSQKYRTLEKTSKDWAGIGVVML